MDFFVVAAVTFRLLYVLVVITHERRKVIHFNITEAPSAEWTAQQVVNAFPYDTAPKYLLRDRDGIYGSAFVQRLEGMGIQQKLISPLTIPAPEFSEGCGLSAWQADSCAPGSLSTKAKHRRVGG